MCLPSGPDIPDVKEPDPLPDPTPMPSTAPPPQTPTLPPPPAPQAVNPAPAPPLPPIPVAAPAPQLVTGENLDDSGKVKGYKSKRAQLQQAKKGSGTRIKKKKKDELAIDKGGLGGQAEGPGTVNIQD
jgi:hypothetical protein